MSIENNAPQPGLWTEIEDVNTLQIVEKCRSLIDAYQNGNLGDCVLPEDSAPKFTEEQTEEKLRYFTLPMSLNYRRNSTQLWAAAQLTYEDESTHAAFSPDVAERFSLTELQDRIYLN